MKVLFVCNDLDYFLAHRVALARDLLARGDEVLVAAGGVTEHNSGREPGLRILPLGLDMHRFRPGGDAALVRQLFGLIRRERPDMVHTFTAKPNLFGSLALVFARLAGRPVPALVMTFPGLGKIYEPGDGIAHRLRRSVVTAVYRLARRFNDPVVTTENPFDARFLATHGIARGERAVVVMGAGIDTGAFTPAGRDGAPVVLFAARLIAGKGVRLFIRAAEELGSRFPEARFVVAGPLDEDNPDRIPREEIDAAVARGAIEYVGNVGLADMPGLLRSADVFCMASMLREGLPRSIIEAAACGCFVVASNQVSVRQVVRDGETGRLFETGNQSALTTALGEALADIAGTRRKGVRGAELMRELPVSEDDVSAAFRDAYDLALGRV
ncbi:glycosyltransferase [Oricola thermophila]|uniref:Glycosyltransferase n=1 Tax=Oricola thermophila TaxID=2742145 RepID=A0A6N1VD06_9HYPH|nr:glycosyltransferase [Oricola thermophila]QKV18780.1 glycosyltransferase [Oricola thermophila]